MKSSIKTQRKVVNFPKKPIIGTSSFKVTSGRLIDGKCTSKAQFDTDSEEEEEEVIYTYTYTLYKRKSCLQILLIY